MPETEFKKLLEAMDMVGTMIWRNPDGSVKEDITYKDIILMYPLEELKEAAETIYNFIKKCGEKSCKQ
jgi:hypothetical protein